MTDMDAGGGANASPLGNQKPAGDTSAKDMALAAVDTVKQEAASFAEVSKDKLLDKVEEKKQVATATLGDFANAIRTAGEELSRSDQSMAARLVKQAADGLEELSRSVTDKGPGEMVEAVRSFGRNNPTAFIAGSVLVGLALGRFLRSSDSHAQSAQGIDAPMHVPSQDFGQSVAQLGQGQGQGEGASQGRGFGEGSEDESSSTATRFGRDTSDPADAGG